MTNKERFIVLLDSEHPRKSDAIILLEGDGFSRYKKAISLYNNGFAPVIVFSGGFDNEKSGAYSFDKVKPLIFKEGVPEKDLLYESKSLNTYEQAVEVINIAKSNRWKRIILVASHYHSYRAFLTFIYVQKQKMPELIIDMASVNDLDWYEETGWGRRIDLLASEFEKIDLYQKKNNVASFTEGIKYIEWKYQKSKKT